MAEGKWLSGLTPDRDATQAGRHILENRFAVLIRAAEDLHTGEPRAAVHQLRVGTRRAEEALRLLRPCMRPKIQRATRAWLRALRRTAGAVRDADVLLGQVQERVATAGPEERPGLELLLGHLLGQRVRSESELLPLTPEGMESALEHCLAGLRDSDPDTFGPLARAALRRALRRFNKTLRTDLDDEANLHRVRIAGKKLRYVLELTGPCVDSSLVQQVYPRIEALQEMLGRVNDSHTTLNRLAPLDGALPLLGEPAAAHYRPGLDALRAEYRQRLRTEREAFVAWVVGWRETAPAIA